MVVDLGGGRWVEGGRWVVGEWVIWQWDRPWCSGILPFLLQWIIPI